MAAGIYIEAEAEAFTEGVVTAVNRLQYIHLATHSVAERRHYLNIHRCIVLPLFIWFSLEVLLLI